MPNPLPKTDSPAAFFALTFLLSMPFYILNALAFRNVVGGPELGPVYVSLFTVTPIASAALLTWRRRGSRGLKALIGRIFEFKRIEKTRWYLAILLLPPLLFLLPSGVMVSLGEPVPPALVPLVALPAVLGFFFLLAAGEEVGWMGYAFEPMQTRMGALGAALMLGIFWAMWHVPFFVFLMPNPAIHGAHLVTLVATRVLAVWIFNNTGKSVFAAILFHAADNTALVILPEVSVGTPLGSAVYTGHVLAAAVFVTWLWGPRTLARFRFVGPPCD